MKKFLSLFLIAVLCLSLASCASEPEPEPLPVDLGNNEPDEPEPEPPVYSDYALPHDEELKLTSTAAEIMDHENVDVQVVLNATLQYSFSSAEIAGVSFASGHYTFKLLENNAPSQVYYSTNYSVDDVNQARTDLEARLTELYGERDQNGQWPLFLDEQTSYAVSLVDMTNPEDPTQRRLVVSIDRSGPPAKDVSINYSAELPSSAVSSLYSGMSYDQVVAALGGASNLGMEDGALELFYWAQKGAEEKTAATLVCCLFKNNSLLAYNLYNDVYLGA